MWVIDNIIVREKFIVINRLYRINIRELWIYKYIKNIKLEIFRKDKSIIYKIGNFKK